MKFFIKNYKSILKGIFGLIILYWLIFFLTPKISMSYEEKGKIDSLNNIIKKIYKDQKKLDSSINNINLEIKLVDKTINDIKGQKTIIREIYHEEINRVSNYSDTQLDSFFTNRYGYRPR